MALTGLEIYKHLPKTNCGECGSPTCLAFAMRLAQKKGSLDECPHISEQGRAALGEASAPPIHLVTIGTGDEKIEIGNETVLFRHDLTFFHPPGLAIEVEDTLTPPELEERIRKINSLSFERVGMILRVNLVALANTSGDPAWFGSAVKTTMELSKLPLILMSKSAQVMEEGLKIASDARPLIYAATAENLEEFALLAKRYSCPLAVLGKDLSEIPVLTDKIKAMGVRDLVLDSGARDIAAALADQTQIRRLALRKIFRPLGFPTIAFASGSDPYEEVVRACVLVSKYAGIIVMRGTEPWQILPIVTLRQNIYTDPQKPIQVEPKLYSFGNVTEDSPTLVTTNFSLTYFTVAGEIEASKIPTYLVVVDTEGTSVLTSWAADKFNAIKITAALRSCGIEGLLRHRRLVIPGYVAVLAAPIEDESGWKAVVGPKEAAGIPAFLKSRGPNWTDLELTSAHAR